MPEGAECRIISEGLARKVGKRTCVSITPLTGRYTKGPIPGVDSFVPARVVGVGVKGKLIFWILENETFLLSTLGMSGTWTSNPDHKHARVRFDFDTGDPVFFVDARNFGTLKLLRGKAAFLKKINSLGPDLLNEDVDHERFAAAMDTKAHWTVAKALMNQSVVCGVGNYVKAEALYRAQISPHRLVGSLSTEEMKALNLSCQIVLRQAYNGRGASIRTYRDADGNTGDATLTFLVYGRRTDPHGNLVVREETTDGRTTHWVPSVQK
jgi:formamidopyrimidine-DNA glycosylase